MISCSKALGAVSRMLWTVLKSVGQASSWKQRMTLAVGRPLVGCCCRHLRGRVLGSLPGDAEKAASSAEKPATPHSSCLAGPLRLWLPPHPSSVALPGFQAATKKSQNTLQKHIPALNLQITRALLNPASSFFVLAGSWSHSLRWWPLTV